MLVRKLCYTLLASTSWETFVNEFRGPSYLSPELDNVDHPAATLLRMWRDEGVFDSLFPVDFQIDSVPICELIDYI